MRVLDARLHGTSKTCFIVLFRGEQPYPVSFFTKTRSKLLRQTLQTGIQARPLQGRVPLCRFLDLGGRDLRVVSIKIVNKYTKILLLLNIQNQQ